MLIRIFCFLCAVSCLHSWAASDNYVSFDFGAQGTNLKQRYEVAEAKRGLISSISAYARLRAGFALSKKTFFEPSLGLGLPWRTGQDGTTKNFWFQSDFDLRFLLSSWFSFRVGPGVQSNLVTAKSATLELNNGTGTSTFYVPEGIAVSAALTVQFGLVFQLSHPVSLNLDVIAVDVGDWERSDYHALLTLGYRL